MSILKKLSIEQLLKNVLAVFVFLFPWQTIWIYKEKSLNGFKWEYGTLGFFGSEVLLWIVIGLFIVWYWKRVKGSMINDQFSMTRDRVFVLSVLAFLLYCFASSLWAIDREVAFQQALRIMEASLLFFVLLLSPFNKEKIVQWLVAGAAIQSVLGIWQFLTQSTFGSVLLGLPLHVAMEPGTSVIQFGLERWLRAYGAFPHPNVFGGYLVVSLCCTGFLLWKNGMGVMKKELKNYRITELFLPISFFLEIAALFFTFSRSAWLSAGIVFILSCIHVFKQRKFFYHISGLLLFVVLTIAFFPIVTARTHETSSTSRSVAERISGYNEAVKLFYEHPLVGVGVGNYTAALHVHTPSLPGYVYQPVHNVPLLFLVETGTVGVLLLIGVVASFLLYKKSKTMENESPPILHSQFFILALSPFFLFDHYLYSSWVGLLLIAFVLGFLARFSARAVE